MLATAAPPALLVCTIQTVESDWTPRAIKGIRQLEQQRFRLIPAPKGFQIEPRTVIESRLTALLQQFKSSALVDVDQKRLEYRWSYASPLGTVGFDQEQPLRAEPTTVDVTGSLVLHNKSRFELTQRSRLIRSDPERPLSSLNERASGVCREQR